MQLEIAVCQMKQGRDLTRNKFIQVVQNKKFA